MVPMTIMAQGLLPVEWMPFAAVVLLIVLTVLLVIMRSRSNYQAQIGTSTGMSSVQAHYSPLTETPRMPYRQRDLQPRVRHSQGMTAAVDPESEFTRIEQLIRVIAQEVEGHWGEVSPAAKNRLRFASQHLACARRATSSSI